jgi:hypothetical protein
MPGLDSFSLGRAAVGLAGLPDTSTAKSDPYNTLYHSAGMTG